MNRSTERARRTLSFAKVALAAALAIAMATAMPGAAIIPIEEGPAPILQVDLLVQVIAHVIQHLAEKGLIDGGYSAEFQGNLVPGGVVATVTGGYGSGFTNFDVMQQNLGLNMTQHFISGSASSMTYQGVGASELLNVAGEIFSHVTTDFSGPSEASGHNQTVKHVSIFRDKGSDAMSTRGSLIVFDEVIRALTHKAAEVGEFRTKRENTDGAVRFDQIFPNADSNKRTVWVDLAVANLTGPGVLNGKIWVD